MITYAVKHKDDDIILKSRSGGFFTAISDFVLSSDGVVYGCILNEHLQAMHVRADNKTVRDLMRGSKYVQSSMGDCFKQAKDDLLKDKMVLFTGTPCQITGFKNFLGNGYENLICVDILCQGVPSPLVLKKYLEHYGTRFTSLEFRNKVEYGWRDHVETMKNEKGEKISSRIFGRLFHSNHALRPACYRCPFKSISHPGDITIGDFWGIENVFPEWDKNTGVSLVMVNNDKGKFFFEKCKSDVLWKETNIEFAMQRVFIKPEERPYNREAFWYDFNALEFKYVIKKYVGETSYLKRMAGAVKRRILLLLSKMSGDYE